MCCVVVCVACVLFITWGMLLLCSVVFEVFLSCNVQRWVMLLCNNVVSCFSVVCKGVLPLCGGVGLLCWDWCVLMSYRLYEGRVARPVYGVLLIRCAVSLLCLFCNFVWGYISPGLFQNFYRPYAGSGGPVLLIIFVLCRAACSSWAICWCVVFCMYRIASLYEVCFQCPVWECVLLMGRLDVCLSTILHKVWSVPVLITLFLLIGLCEGDVAGDIAHVLYEVTRYPFL